MDLNKYYTPKDIENIIGLNIRMFNRCYKNNGFFKTLIVVDDKYYVLKEEIDSLKEEIKLYDELTDFSYVEEASKFIGINSETLLKYIKKGYFPNAIKTRFNNSKWKIPNNNIEDFIVKHPKKENKIVEPKTTDVKYVDNLDLKQYFDIDTACKAIALTNYKFMQIYRGNGFFKTLVSYKDNYYIEKNEILSLQKELNYYKNLDNYYKLDEVAKKIGYSTSHLLLIIKDIFPTASNGIYKTDWKIPKEDVDKYIIENKENVEDLSNFNIDEYYSLKNISKKFNISEKPLRNLINYNNFSIIRFKQTIYIPKQEIDTLDISDVLSCPDKDANEEERWNFYKNKYYKLNKIPKTIDLYKNYYFFKIKSTNIHNKMKYCQRLLLGGLKFLNHLDKEIYLYNDDELSLIFNKVYKYSYAKDAVSFVNYVRTKVKHCCYQEKYNYTNKITKKTDKEIYTKQDFKNMYLYIKDIDFHIEKALENVVYAECWFYISMHFINAWRATDIIEFPYTNLDTIKPLTKEFLLTNKLSIEDGQEIVNIIRERNLLMANKNGVLNKFLVNKDMLATIATIILILEYHYKESNSKILMPYFKDKGVLQTNIQMFLGEKFNHIRFNNRVSNRTLLTYFHYNVTQSSKNGDIAHLLSTRMRGHISQDTISQYVMNTNEEDFFDDISYHLFNRGHFGWLFNSLLEISIASKTKELTIDEKTLIIEKYQKFYTPYTMEKVSKFLLTQQNQTHSVALEIASIPNKDIIERLESVFKGYMPCKEEYGQCIYSKSCKNPYSDCKSCPYLIPKVYLLNSLKTDIEAIINNLKDIEEYQIPERIKLTTILFKLMSLLNQAVIEFGKEYTSTFINIDNLKYRLSEINNKLLTSNRKE